MDSDLSRQINVKQLSSNTYQVSYDPEWKVGQALYGGFVIAQIYHVADHHLRNDPAVVKRNQPDVLSMHAEFLNPCDAVDSIITVTPLRIGALASTFQFSLSQKEKLRVMALVTSTDFDKSIGPTGQSAWTLLPPPPPKPDLERVLVNKPEENWVPFTIEGEILPASSKYVTIYPRSGFQTEGAYDYWIRLRDRRIQMSSLAPIIDNMPSMADTMLRTGTIWDGHAALKRASDMEAKNPGAPSIIKQTWKEAFKAEFFPFTLTLDVEFKRRLPKEGLRIVQIRQQVKKLEKGRMDFESIIHDENGNLVCNARQVQFILPSARKLKSSGSKQKSSL